MIDMRLRRVEEGNLGDWKAVGGGVRELRVHEGHGFRVYFAQDGKEVVILLLGAAKKTKRQQTQDISQAMTYWTDYKERKKRGTGRRVGAKKGPRRRR